VKIINKQEISATVIGEIFTSFWMTFFAGVILSAAKNLVFFRFP